MPNKLSLKKQNKHLVAMDYNSGSLSAAGPMATSLSNTAKLPIEGKRFQIGGHGAAAKSKNLNYRPNILNQSELLLKPQKQHSSTSST